MNSEKERLWLIASKLHGLAALIKNWNGQPLATDNDTHDTAYGLGMIIADLADEVYTVHKELK